MRKSAEDMELSCDDTVLLSADDDTRRRYASLLLNAAGDGRGFTTCLSASARTMRYRLKNITRSAGRHSGALMVGLMFFLLCMTSGYVALAYDGKSGEELIYNNENISRYTLRYISGPGDEYNTNYEAVDEAAFHRYLSELTLFELTGNYSFPAYEAKFNCLMDTPGGILSVILYDNVIKIVPLGEIRAASFYYIEGGVDWEYLSTIIVARPSASQEVYKNRSKLTCLKTKLALEQCIKV